MGKVNGNIFVTLEMTREEFYDRTVTPEGKKTAKSFTDEELEVMGVESFGVMNGFCQISNETRVLCAQIGGIQAVGLYLTLLSHVNIKNAKSEEEKKLMMGEYLQTMRSGKNMIFDRCWYSEMAYGPVMRDASIISYPEMYELEEQLAKCGAIIIYATGPKAALWQRCQRRGEEYVTSRDDFNAICDNFDSIMKCPHHIPVVRYEFKD